MPAITYNLNVPNPPNNPSQDVTPMQTNTNSINQWNGVDHYEFANDFAGWHSQLSFPAWGSSTVPTGTADQGAVAYTAAGMSDATTSDLYFKTSKGTFLINPIRAFCVFSSLGAAGNITPSNYSNISGNIVQSSTGAFNTNWTITLNSNTTTSDNACILMYNNSLASLLYTFSANVLVIRNASPLVTIPAGTAFSIVILQA